MNEQLENLNNIIAGIGGIATNILGASVPIVQVIGMVPAIIELFRKNGVTLPAQWTGPIVTGQVAEWQNRLSTKYGDFMTAEQIEEWLKEQMPEPTEPENGN